MSGFPMDNHELEARNMLAKLLIIGHAEYVPADMHLEPDQRRIRLTESGLRERERILKAATLPPV